MTKEANPNVYVFFMDIDTCVQILIQGYELGLFKADDDQIIFVSNTCRGQDMINHIHVKYPSYISQIPKLMKGIIGIHHNPLFSVQYTTEGQAFMTKFQQRQSIVDCNTQLNTHWNGSTTQIKAGQVVDDNVPHYEHLFRRNSSSNVCKNVNFGSLSVSNLWEYAPYVYDATIVLAKAYHQVLEVDNVTLNQVTDEMLTKAVCGLPMFNGVTGEVAFFNGVGDNISDDQSVLHGKGDREVGLDYNIENYNAKVQEFVRVGHIDHESTFQLCDERLTDQQKGILVPCNHFVEYNTADGLRPPDANPNIYNEPGIEVVTFFVVIGAAGITYIIFIALTLLVYRKTKLVKASQPPMMAIILIGQLFSYIRVIIGGDHPTPTVCMNQFWFGHLAFIFVFGSMTIKTWRVYKIISNNSLKRVKISNWDVMKLIMSLIALGIVYIIIVQTVGESTVSEEVVTVSNQSTYYTTCSFKHIEFQTTIYILEAILLVYGWRICSVSQDAPSAINESHPISSAISIICLISVIVLPLTSFIRLSPTVICIFTSMGFWAASSISTTLVFGPKLLILLQGKDIDWGDQNKKDSNAKFASDSKITSELDNVLIDFVTKYMHGKSVDEKYVICHKQVEWWKKMQVSLEDKRTSDNSNSRLTNSSSFVKAESEIVMINTETAANTDLKIETIGSIDP